MPAIISEKKGAIRKYQVLEKDTVSFLKDIEKKGNVFFGNSDPCDDDFVDTKKGDLYYDITSGTLYAYSANNLISDVIDTKYHISNEFKIEHDGDISYGGLNVLNISDVNTVIFKIETPSVVPTSGAEYEFIDILAGGNITVISYDSINNLLYTNYGNPVPYSFYPNNGSLEKTSGTGDDVISFTCFKSFTGLYNSEAPVELVLFQLELNTSNSLTWKFNFDDIFNVDFTEIDVLVVDNPGTQENLQFVKLQKSEDGMNWIDILTFDKVNILDEFVTINLQENFIKSDFCNNSYNYFRFISIKDDFEANITLKNLKISYSTHDCCWQPISFKPYNWYKRFTLPSWHLSPFSTFIMPIENLPKKGWYQVDVFCTTRENYFDGMSQAITQIAQKLEAKFLNNTDYTLIDVSGNFDGNITAPEYMWFNNSLQGSAIIFVDSDICDERTIQIKVTCQNGIFRSINEFNSGYCHVNYLGSAEEGELCT